MSRETISQQKNTSLIPKAILILVFLFGICVIFTGRSGLKTYENSGFSSETAFQAIYKLSVSIDSDWKKIISPVINSLSADQREGLDAKLHKILREEWESRKKGAGEELSQIPDGSNGQSEELGSKLLYLAYQTGGPKVSSSIKKQLTSVKAEEQDQFLQSLLAAAADDSAAIPDAAASAVENLTGMERDAMLMQLFYTKISEIGSTETEDINMLKKGVRDKEAQITAFQMTALKEVSWLRQFVISHTRTVILAGILLSLDALLLAFLMGAGKTWEFDVKWIIILLIVDFLILFQMMPLVYMLIKSFYPDGAFSLETFKRLYTYALNQDALKNTLIAAFSTMILGTAIAFPLRIWFRPMWELWPGSVC